MDRDAECYSVNGYWHLSTKWQAQSRFTFNTWIRVVKADQKKYDKADVTLPQKHPDDRDIRAAEGHLLQGSPSIITGTAVRVYGPIYRGHRELRWIIIHVE
jgi:hypothetical protein